MKSIAAAAERARAAGDLAPVIDAIPYAGLLGIQARYGDELLFCLPPKQGNVGNPTLPALHGGAIGGFMELAGSLHLIMTMEVLKVPKVVDFSIDYVRAGRVQDTYAACHVVRQGRKLVNVAIQAWQDNRAEPIATARAHFLLE
ncbi:PaaI family thioesterase [Exilibacterium tricleocarpae]|uniref:PaaI family thioesterase n=1 Tax=Exilibacterium tricleocarpae TaxID=2591008 RepID=A0A545SRS6_9GAMM|nr:PaaI family thioesterase [Exilibacterium tricleocarpae]TQV67673.1 PaaI family thioesterase [Exilibacterium tricleocarpae]